MIEFLNQLVASYARKGVLLDTNVLLLYLIGQYDVNYIANFGRTSQFTKESFLTLQSFIANFSKIYITPHILTEVSNFSFQLTNTRLQEYIMVFKETISHTIEDCTDKNILMDSNVFLKFGITDSSIFKSVEKFGFLVVTTDFPLSNLLSTHRFGVLNFNNVIFN